MFHCSELVKWSTSQKRLGCIISPKHEWKGKLENVCLPHLVL